MSENPAAGWNWAQFRGSDAALNYARRELNSVDEALSLFNGRRVVVQAGGSLGIFPKYLSGFFKAVYTFEPDPELFRIMLQNAPEVNIVAVQAALGCDRKLVGTSRTRRDGSLRAPHEGVTHVSGSGIIPTLQLDDLNLSTCDLIYLDVEGFELYVLLGAVRTIEHCRPVIVVEINKQLQHFGLSEHDVLDFMKSHNYRETLRAGSDVAFVPWEKT